MDDEAETEGLTHIGYAAWRVLADVCRLRKDFLQGQVTGAGEQGEEPTQPAPDAVRRSWRSRRLNRSADGM